MCRGGSCITRLVLASRLVCKLITWPKAPRVAHGGMSIEVDVDQQGGEGGEQAVAGGAAGGFGTR